MPAFDQCHGQVVRALEKDGWVIESQPVMYLIGRRRVFVDLQARRQVNGSGQQVMLVEVKCFPDPDSTTHELYAAIGQYIMYRAILKELAINVSLYLSIPEEVFEDIFDVVTQNAIRDNQIKLVIVNLGAERIIRWIE